MAISGMTSIMRATSREATDIVLSAIVASDSVLETLKKGNAQDRALLKSRTREVAFKGLERVRIAAWPRQEIQRLYEELLEQLFGAATPEEREALWNEVVAERKKTRAGL